jgi:hypothetical protein
MVGSFEECEGLVKSGIPFFEIFATSSVQLSEAMA